MTKTKLRTIIKQKLGSLSKEAIAAGSGAVIRAVCAEEAYKMSVALFAFMSLPAEVQTAGLIRRALAAGKRVFVPRVAETGLMFHEISAVEDASVLHAYGMAEPPAVLPCFPACDGDAEPACMLVPGLAFDRHKNRLGRGRGYYDAFLTALRRDHPHMRCTLIGVCLNIQLVDALPVTAHDVPVDIVLTESERIA